MKERKKEKNLPIIKKTVFIKNMFDEIFLWVFHKNHYTISFKAFGDMNCI